MPVCWKTRLGLNCSIYKKPIFLAQIKNPHHLGILNIYNIIHSCAPHDDRGSGICIFVNKTENILASEILLQGRLVYLKLECIATNVVTNVFSYYGKSTNRSEQWLQNFEIISEKIVNDSLENIIILGDFNFVASVFDRNSRAFTSTDLSANNHWLSLENTLGIKDCFRITNPKRVLYTLYTYKWTIKEQN